MSELLVGGELIGGAGTQSPGTKGVTGAQRVQFAHGEYTDRAARGQVFWLTSGAVTLDAANVTASALGTATLICGFYNPVGSGYNAAILRARVDTVSGTPGGPYFYDYYPNLTVTNAASGAVRPALLAGVGSDSVVTPVNDAAIVHTGNSTANLLTLGGLGGLAAVAAGVGVYSVVDEVRGSIIVPPGCVFGITCKAAGTTHIVHATLVWEELQAIA
jgi:hypothetical protein